MDTIIPSEQEPMKIPSVKGTSFKNITAFHVFGKCYLAI
jgi:hypothetical protein